MLRRWLERRKSTQTLQSLPLFAGADRADLRAADRLLTEVNVPAGRVLTRQGERGLDFAIVVEGTAEVARDDDVVAELGPGAFFGELALIDGSKRTATVTARTPMRLFVLHRVEFDRLLEILPSVRAAVLEAASTRRHAPALATAA